jgi:N-acyl-D-amino-acid deacylase
VSLYDLVIKNGILADTEQSVLMPGHLGIMGNRIEKVTTETIHGVKEIDAAGLIVSPGFIDIHGHVDGHIPCACLSVLQGVTTTVGGNCGFGPLKLKEFFYNQECDGCPINQAQLIGHSFSLREIVGITNPYVPAKEEEIERMCEILEQGFKDGAIGLSFGLEYAPGTSFEEMTRLSSLAKKYNKIVSVHTNMKCPDDLESLREIIQLGEKTGAHILISHFVYQYGSGVMTEALEIVDDARSRGVKISVDSGMYTSFATFIGAAIFDEENIKKFNYKYEDILVSSGIYKGKRLNYELYKEMREKYSGETVICFTGVEEEIYEAIVKDYVVLSSDIGPAPSGRTNEGHPQNAGTFPRFFRRLVREQNRLPLIDAIIKCTLMPAEILDIKRKGRLSEGADADLVVFDINTIKDNARFPDKGEPDAKPDGISYVIVNGEIVVDHNQISSHIRSGKVIKGLIPDNRDL